MIPVKKPYRRTAYYGQRYSRNVLNRYPALKRYPYFGRCLGYEYVAQGRDKGIYSPMAGKITFVGKDKYGAVMVKIQKLTHPCYKWIIQLGHMKNKSIRVKKGQKVKMGQKIGTQGRTGRATGDHVQIKTWGGTPRKIRNPKQILLLKPSKKKPKPKPKLTRTGLLKVIYQLLKETPPQAILNALRKVFKV